MNPIETVEMTHVLRSKEAARASYNKLSTWYDLIAGGSEKKFREKGLELLNVMPGESIIEVGCGTGHSLLTLSQQVGPAGRVYGLDLSDGMLGQARSRLNRSETGKWTMLLCSDAAHLPFRTESFDALFMSFTLELFDTPELPLVLNECHRVLKHDGRMSVVSLSKKRICCLCLRMAAWTIFRSYRLPPHLHQGYHHRGWVPYRRCHRTGHVRAGSRYSASQQIIGRWIT